MPRFSLVLLLCAGGALSGCASADVTGAESPVETTVKQGTAAPSSPDAGTLLDGALDKLLAQPTGRIEQKVQLGDEKTGIAISSDVSYDLTGKAWRTRQWYRQGSEPETIMESIVTPDAVFLTMEGWPEKLHGRWLRFSADQLRQLQKQGSPAGSLGIDADTVGTPPAIQALVSAKARSVQGEGGGRYVSVDLGAAEAIALANLQAGMRKLNVDPDTLSGVVPAYVWFSLDGGIGDLQVMPGSFGAVDGLPPELVQAANAVSVDAQFDARGFFEEPTAPADDQLIDPKEMKP